MLFKIYIICTLIGVVVFGLSFPFLYKTFNEEQYLQVLYDRKKISEKN